MGSRSPCHSQASGNNSKLLFRPKTHNQPLVLDNQRPTVNLRQSIVTIHKQTIAFQQLMHPVQGLGIAYLPLK